MTFFFICYYINHNQSINQHRYFQEKQNPIIITTTCGGYGWPYTTYTSQMNECEGNGIFFSHKTQEILKNFTNEK